MNRKKLRKASSKRSYPEDMEKERTKVRKMVETAISEIVGLMPRWIQTITEKGFEF